MKTKQELIELWQDNEEFREEIRYSWGNKEGVTIDGYLFKNAETHGGGEGDGEEHWVVFSMEKEGQKEFWKVPGWYQSYHGGELEADNMFRVNAVPVQRMEWQAVK